MSDYSDASYIDLTDIAYHEAGHAVCCFALKVPVYQATIVPEGYRSGHVSHAALGDLRWHKRVAERDLIIALSGDLAERRHNPDRRRGDSRDLDKAANILDAMSRPDDPFQKQFHMQKWFMALSAEAEEIIERWWPAVDALAAALVDKRTLNGLEISRCIRAAMPNSEPMRAKTPLRCEALPDDGGGYTHLPAMRQSLRKSPGED